MSTFESNLNEMRRRAGLPPINKKRPPVTESTDTDEVTIYLADDDDMMQEQKPIPVRLVVKYEVEPTEYEGSHVFYQGGVSVTDAKIYESFEFLGKKYPHSQSFPDELLRHVVTANGDTIHRAGQDPWNNFMDHLSERLANYGDIHVPSQRYPDSRMTEAEVDTSFLGRRQEQMQQDTEQGVGRIQTELQTKLKIREQTAARLATTIADELQLRAKRMVLLHPEHAEGKTAEQLLTDMAYDREFDEYVEPILDAIKEQIRSDIGHRR